jgi:choline kinase
MTAKDFTAVILAAGRGERLRPLTSSIPKSLISVGGYAILGRTLEHLRAVGIGSVIIIAGYRAAKIQKFMRDCPVAISFRILRNPIYHRTNTLYSLWVGRKAVAGKPFLLLDGDLVFEERALAILLRPKMGNVLVCDAARNLDDEAVCAAGTAGGRVLQVGKHMSPKGKVFGESIGMARIDGRTSQKLFQIAGKLLRNRGLALYYEAGFQKLMDGGVPFWAVDLRGTRWTEIDTKSDLRRARALFKQSSKPAR